MTTNEEDGKETLIKKEFLTLEEFVNASKTLEQLSENLQVNWKLEPGKSDASECFLKYVCHQPIYDTNNIDVDASLKSTFIQLDADDDDDEESIKISEDVAETELTSGNEKTDCILLRCEYHIVFNTSYSVPVIYFNISRPDGSLLTLDEVWSMFLAGKGKEKSSLDMWGTLSQQDHPVLNIPFFTLHPCHTSNIMGSLWNNTKNPPLSYLITWLSIIGGELHLSIANELGQHLVSCGDESSSSSSSRGEKSQVP